jgi:hypothetical protein
MKKLQGLKVLRTKATKLGVMTQVECNRCHGALSIFDETHGIIVQCARINGRPCADRRLDDDPTRVDRAQGESISPAEGATLIVT